MAPWGRQKGQTSIKWDRLRHDRPGMCWEKKMTTGKKVKLDGVGERV